MLNPVEIVSVPVIAAVVYVLIEIYKKVSGGSEKYLRFIPLISCVLGVGLGIIAFYALPTIIPANDLFTAVLIGGASGLAATGTNQIFKQLFKGKEDGNDERKK